MAGIASLTTPEKWNAHLCDQVAQIVTHLQKDQLSQAYKIFQDIICPYADEINDCVKFFEGRMDISLCLREFSLAIYDHHSLGPEHAKRVENIALSYLSGFKPAIRKESPKSAAPVITEIDAIERLLWGPSPSDLKPVIVKPVAQRARDPLTLDTGLGLKPVQTPSQEPKRPVKRASTPLAQNNQSLSLGVGPAPGATKKDKPVNQGFDFADSYITRSRTPSPTFTIPPSVYRSQDNSPTTQIEGLDRSTLPTLQFISGEATDFSYTEPAASGEDFSGLIENIALMEDQAVLNEIGASTSSLEVRAAIDKRLAQLKPEYAPG